MASDPRPILFLLPPDFLDPEEGKGAFVCPHCMAVEGLLSVYPRLRRELDVRYTTFLRPRTALLDLIGHEHQACPVLILPPGERSTLPSSQMSHDRTFFHGEHAIAEALAERFGTGRMH